jgi:hypothetical protein
MIENLNKKDKFALVYITVLTIIAVWYGFSLIPSRTATMSMVYDHKRIIDLGEISDTIDDYYGNTGKLPATLGQLNYNADDTTPLNKIDPETKQPYRYIITSSTTYKLCATFATNSSKDDPNAYDDANEDYASFIDDFAHPAGYYCFNENESGDSSGSFAPSPACLGDCQSPAPTVPIIRPCRSNNGVTMCPMIRVNPLPTVYNSNTATPANQTGSAF